MSKVHSTAEYGEHAAELDRLFEQYTQFENVAEDHGFDCPKRNAAADRAFDKYQKARSDAFLAMKKPAAVSQPRRKRIVMVSRSKGVTQIDEDWQSYNDMVHTLDHAANRYGY